MFKLEEMSTIARNTGRSGKDDHELCDAEDCEQERLLAFGGQVQCNSFLLSSS